MRFDGRSELVRILEKAGYSDKAAAIAKLTDQDEEVVGLLRYRAFDLFGFEPQGYEY